MNALASERERYGLAPGTGNWAAQQAALPVLHNAIPSCAAALFHCAMSATCSPLRAKWAVLLLSGLERLVLLCAARKDCLGRLAIRKQPYPAESVTPYWRESRFLDFPQREPPLGLRTVAGHGHREFRANGYLKMI